MDLDMTGGAADIFKCFDQLSRPLIYAILEKAGMPEKGVWNIQEILGRTNRV